MINLRRFENISLHSVMDGLRITDIPWLAPPTASATAKLSLTDFKKRTELLAEFVYWFFDSIVVHLIRTNFYATETSVHKNRVLYFRHDVWRSISTPSISKLQENMLTRVSRVDPTCSRLNSGRGATDIGKQIYGILLREIPS